jgi:hypothetical protein
VCGGGGAMSVRAVCVGACVRAFVHMKLRVNQKGGRCFLIILVVACVRARMCVCAHATECD